MTEATIRITVNGREREIPTGLSVEELLGRFDVHPGAVVVEMNRDILKRDSYRGHQLREGDVLELVHFVGGG